MAVVQIQRSNVAEPWGFRLQGGRDFSMQLQVKKVLPGTPAEGRLHQGDAILTIGNHNAQQLSHMQAHQLIRNAGTTLSLTVAKGQYGGMDRLDNIKPKGPVKFSPWRHQ